MASVLQTPHATLANGTGPTPSQGDPFAPLDDFARRHLGPQPKDLAHMLATVGVDSLDQLIDATVPTAIRLARPLNLPAAKSEREALADLRSLAQQNQIYRSFIGMGYYDTLTPGVILRNVLENRIGFRDLFLRLHLLCFFRR